MRTAIFSLAYLPFVGGAELAVKEITDRLPEHNFLCFTYKFDRSWSDYEKIGNVEIIRVGKGFVDFSSGGSQAAIVKSTDQYYGHRFKKLWYILKLWIAAERFYKKENFQLVWAMMASYAGIAALLFKFFHPKIPLLLTLQEGDSEKHILKRVGIFYPLWKMLFKKADLIHVISSYLGDFARRHGAKCPIVLIPNGVDINFYKADKPDKPNKADELYTIITTSRLVPKNGIDILLRSAVYLSNYKLVIIGGGPEEQNLKELSKELNIENNVEFIGQISAEQVSEYLAKADIFVRPSRSEGLGSSFLEAMAAGLPVIGTPVGGIPDFLKDRVTGLFVKVDDPWDLAKKIRELMSDESLRNRLAQNGRQLVREKYNWTNIAINFEKLFTQLVK